MRTEVLNIGFDNITKDEAVAMGEKLLETEGASYIVTPNPEIVWMCREDTKLKETIEKADLVLPDGIGIVYGARILGRPLKEKIPGIDFISGLFGRMAESGKTVFLLGAKPGVAQRAGAELSAKYPGLTVCGVHDGYFKEDGPVIEEINRAAPDLLLVCLGAPKQEYWMAKNRDKLHVKLMAGLGGSLDVFAGEVKRAPVFFQKLGLEWFHRLLKEPWRIKRMMKLPLFLFAVMGQRIKGK